MVDKNLWVAKFKRITCDLEDVARKQAILVQEQRSGEIESLPKADKLLFDMWNAIPDMYVKMKKYAFGVLSIFGSTYLCEQVFSNMNYIKSRHCSCLTGDSLQSCMKLKDTAYSPDEEKLCSDVQKQKSHYIGEDGVILYVTIFICSLSIFDTELLLLYAHAGWTIDYCAQHDENRRGRRWAYNSTLKWI